MAYRTQTDEPVAAAVLEAVGAHADRPPESLPPLRESTNTDLEAVLDHLDDGADGAPTEQFTFEYLKYYVTITSDGTVAVESKPEDPFATDDLQL